MKKITSLIFLLATLCIFSASNIFAAWTQAKGHSYNQLGFSYYKTDEKYTTLHRDEGGSLITTDGSIIKKDSAKFTSKKITYYGEYGLTDKITIVASIPYDWQKSDDTIRYAGEDGPSGVGDINLGLRYQLVPDLFGSGVLMSIQGEVKIPEAYDYGHPIFKLSQGDGQYDASVALKFGRGLPKGYLWLDVGYKYRFENDKFDPDTFKPSDQFKLAFGGGYPIVSWLSLTGYVEWSKSIGNARVSDAMVDTAKSTGMAESTVEEELFKDTLSLEKDDLSVYVGLQFNLPAKNKAVPNSIVLSYARDIRGFGDFKTKNNALGETIGLALVYIR